MQGSPLPYDRKALYHAARIYTANARIRALSLSLRAPYYNLYANEVLTALRYVSSLTRGTNFPAIIIRAQAALLQAPASGAQEWSFNPSDVEIGFYEVEYAGYIFSDAWWNESGITASNRSAQLNVAKEDIMDAYKRPDTVPTTVDIQHMPSPMSAPISLAPSHSTPSPALPNYHTLRNAVTPRIPPPSQPALILSAERKRVHKGDAEDSTHAPSATKRPRGRPRKSEARPANKIIFVHRRLAEYEDESELPADAIIVRINSNRYLVGLSSSPRNIAQCEACSAAGATCFKGPNEACTLCSLRKRPCKPLQQSGLATRAVPLQDNARAKKGNRISDYFDKLPDTSAAANGIRPGILTGQSAQEFTPRRLTYTHERGELPRDTVVVIVRQGQPAEIIEYAVGLYSQNQSSTACMQCMKREVPCFPGPGDACTLCVLRDEPCAIFVHDDMEGTTRRHSKAYLELRRPADAELPMFIDQDEQFPEEYVVAELMLADRKRRTQRYLVGRYSWPRRKVECDTCREAGVPCLLNIHKKNPSASGCSLCSLRRAPCRPRRINEDEVEDDDEEESEQVATTTSVALRSASSRQVRLCQLASHPYDILISL
ncbi:hypothetical protein FA95DRAFT_1285766 [Auriscalpium vulgare]|uniref:Uncharacterized protein n=1 Tax=Auriscalpium vulgare TaxID=40419 RepID=A0ACB8RSZ7_9AGAM|nr:hypothetical protein FA95DRAFT_1285766 [Auriscalpium vulgare]